MMPDQIDNAMLCEQVLGWEPQPDRGGGWRTPAGTWKSVLLDFEHDVAAAFMLVEALEEQYLLALKANPSDLYGVDCRWEAELRKPYGEIVKSMKRASTPAQAIARAAWALVKGDDDV